MPIGLMVVMTMVLYKGTVAVVNQTLYHHVGSWPFKYLIPKSCNLPISSSPHISDRQVRYSGLRPPEPADWPPSRPRRTSFRPSRESTHWPLVTVGGRGARPGGYLSSICCLILGSSISPMPKLLIVLTAFDMRPLDKRESAFFLFLVFSFSSDHLSPSSLLTACSLLLPLSLFAAAMSFSSKISNPPQSFSTTQFILCATNPLPAFPPLLPCLNRACGRMRNHFSALSRVTPPSASLIA